MCIVCIPSFVQFDPIEKGCSFELDHLIPLVQVLCRGEIGNTDICVKVYQSLSLSLSLSVLDIGQIVVVRVYTQRYRHFFQLLLRC
jgi:hypothetical protein